MVATKSKVKSDDSKGWKGKGNTFHLVRVPMDGIIKLAELELWKQHLVSR